MYYSNRGAASNANGATNVAVDAFNHATELGEAMRKATAKQSLPHFTPGKLVIVLMKRGVALAKKGAMALASDRISVIGARHIGRSAMKWPITTYYAASPTSRMA